MGDKSDREVDDFWLGIAQGPEAAAALDAVHNSRDGAPPPPSSMNDAADRVLTGLMPPGDARCGDDPTIRVI